jgi:hypothetical protein
MKKPVFYLALMSFTLLSGCFLGGQEDDGPTSFYGTWVRYPGPSGDRTDLAIGGIIDEPDDRVYMCEKVGSTAAGLYKGTLYGDVIVWDDQHGLPDTYIQIVDSELEFDYKCCGAVPTYYGQGDWSGECGPLENTSAYLAVGLDNSDFPWATINSVTIDHVNVPLTTLNANTTEPNCDTKSILLGQPLQSTLYYVRVTFTAEGLNGWYTQTDTKAWGVGSFVKGCNKFKVENRGTGFTIYPM